MPQLSRRLILATLGMILLLLGGCWNRREVETGTIMAVGVDRRNQTGAVNSSDCLTGGVGDRHRVVHRKGVLAGEQYRLYALMLLATCITIVSAVVLGTQLLVGDWRGNGSRWD